MQYLLTEQEYRKLKEKVGLLNDNRKQFTIQYHINERGYVSFSNPCCDEIPSSLMSKILEAISNVEKEWNRRVTNKVSSLPHDTSDEAGMINLLR